MALNLTTGGLAANGATPGVLNPPKQSNIGSFLSTPAPLGAEAPNGLSQGNIQGMINIPQTPKPTTPVKSTTVAHPSGTTVTTQYHAPDTSSPMTVNIPDKPTTPPTTPTPATSGFMQPVDNSPKPTATPPIPYTPPDQGTNGVSQGGLIGNAVGQSQNPNPIAQTAGNNLNNFSTASDPELDYWNKQIADIKSTQGRANMNIDSSGVDQSLATGQEAILNRNYAAQLEAAQTGLSNALAKRGQNITSATNAGGIGNSIQGLQQSALSTAIGANAPQFGVGFGTQVGQPSLPNGGIDSSLNGVSTPANIQSIQTYTGKINDINSQSTAVDNNFSRAINYATSGGLDNNSAIIAGIQNKFKGSVEGNAAIAGFNQVIGQLNQQATTLGFTPVDPNSVTPSQLQQLQVSVKQKLANDIANYQSEKDKLLNGSSSTSGSSTGGTMFGSFF